MSSLTSASLVRRAWASVDGEELDSLEPRLDHAVHGIATATAYPHDLDHGEVVLGWNSHWSSASLLSDGPV